MARERVVINIEVNSDVATIEATRQALERLTRENNDLNDSYERNRRTLREVTKENKRLDRDSDAVGNTLRRMSQNTARATGRFSGFGKQVFSLRKDLGMLIGAFGGMIRVVNKLALLEIPILAAGMATITLLFKSGTGFVNMYRAAMSSLAYAAAGVGVAVTTAVAAMREFQSVQFAPMYVEGSASTTDRFVAASQAMKMFVDNSRLAVVGSESLGKAFGTLSKQSPVTGGTVAAFETLMNVVAGSGGDIGKGAENLAAFLAQVQKSGVGGAGEAAKALGADFEKIIKEAQALGITTQEEFFKAAAEGTLGETFQTKYAGQLDALNNTLIGRFKTAFSEIRMLLTDIGYEFLQPVGEAVMQIRNIITRTILQLSPMIKEFGTETFLADVVNLIDRTATKFVGLMNRYLGTTPGIFEFIGNVFGKIGAAFEKVQDWARQFVDAGQVIIDNFIEPIWNGLMDKFGGGMNTLADLVEANAPLIRSLADNVVDVIAALGEYANMLKRAFIAVIPLINVFLKITEKIFSIWTKISNSLLNLFGSVGGGFGKAMAAVPVLYGSLVLFSRFFKVFGGMFGKDMNIRANNVNVMGPGGSPIGGGSPVGGGGGGRFANSRFGRGFNRVVSRLGGGTTAALIGGSALMAGGQMAGGGSTAGALMTGAGSALNVAALAKFANVSTAGAGYLAAPVAAYGSGKATANFIQNVSGGRLGKDDAVGKLGLAAAGAGTGAATGALIGGAVGGPVGAAIGAVLGTVAGGVAGYLNAGKFQKEARNAAEDLIESYTTSIDDAFAAGDVEGLTKARDEFVKQNKANFDTLKDPATYAKKMEEYQKQLAAIDDKIETYSSNAALAEKHFGLSTDALNKLAEAAGIDPQTQLLNFADVLKLVAKTGTEQSRILKQAWAGLGGQALGGALDVLTRIENRQATSNQLDAAQLTAIAAPTEKNLIDLVKKQIEFSTNRYGEFGGMANAYQTILGAIEGPEFQGMSDIGKANLLNLVTESLDPSTILASIDQTRLAEMLGGMDATKGKTPEQILDMVADRVKGDPTFLANLQYAQTSRNNPLANALLGGTGTGDFMSSPYGAQPIIKGSVPQSIIIETNITAAALDPATMKRITDDINRRIREAQERGGTTTTTGGGR